MEDPRYFLRYKKRLFRMMGNDEERFDGDIPTWTDIWPGISDWLFYLETEVDEIDEATARELFPTAFTD